MHETPIPLIIAIGAFLALILWQIRPAPVGWRSRRRHRREALRDAQARIESAVTPSARAVALCDAADVLAKTLAGVASASGLYLRAIRSDPASPEIVARVAAGLASRPRTLESLLWRHLAAVGSWDGAGREGARASLERLRTLYDGPLRNAVRARALANALDALPRS